VIELPTAFHPATGTIEYSTFDFGAFKPTMGPVSEARPTDRSRVHHIIALSVTWSDWLKDAKPGIPFVPEKQRRMRIQIPASSERFLVGYAPGQPPEKFAPGQDQANPAGSDIIFQVHYTTNGKPGTDRSK